ncbi:MAG: AraC family transcriptional regulator [Chloroflexota bacterium]
MDDSLIRFYTLGSEADVRLVHGQNVAAHTFPVHAHRSFSLGWVEKGRRIIQTNGKTIYVAAGEGFWLNPNQPHTCRIDEPGGHGYWVVSLRPAYVQGLFEQATGLTGLPRLAGIKLSDAPFLADLAAWLKSQPDGNEGHFEALLGALFKSHAGEAAPPAPAHEVWLAATFRQLETCQNEAVLLDELAAAAHVSPFYLHRVFRKAAGVPPHTYLLHTRIKKSLAILLETDSIAAAAQQLGFADQSHFTRLFKRQVGVTPGKFLDTHRKP